MFTMPNTHLGFLWASLVVVHGQKADSPRRDADSPTESAGLGHRPRSQPLRANATAPLARGGLAVGARVPDGGPPVQAVAGASGARDPPRWDVRRHRHRPGRL